MKSLKNYILILVCTLTAFVSYAAELENFNCVSHPPSTSYVFSKEQNKNYQLTVIHHNGLNHAPFYDGLVTLHTIDYLKQDMENMKKLGDRIDTTFHQSQCVRLENNRITCYKSGKGKLGDLEVRDIYFNVYENTDSSTYGVFDEVRTSLEYRVNGRTFRLPMNYSRRDCVSRFN